MTINELIDKLNGLGVGGDQQICVHAFGGMRAGKEIKTVALGIDWDINTVILHTTIPLTIKGVSRDWHGRRVPCEHTSVHWRVNPYEPNIGNSVEVCNECSMSRSHWEQGDSGWQNVDISEFPTMPPHAASTGGKE